jgi:hypothetical protein
MAVSRTRPSGLLLLILVIIVLLGSSVAWAQSTPVIPPLKPEFSQAVAFDVSPPLRTLGRVPPGFPYFRDGLFDLRPEENLVEYIDHGYSGDGALQMWKGGRLPGGLISSFEGLSNQDNFNVIGGRVNPPDPSGAVGPNHYVEEINLVFAIYDRAGTKLAGPFDLGSLWQGFPISGCAQESGDPVVLYDRFSDRWILSQFTPNNQPQYWNCVAISTTGDPTGTYYRYAFDEGQFFPDYPKYGIWRDAYIISSRDFGNDGRYGMSLYGLDKRQMLMGNPHARQVHFFLDSDVIPINLLGDGLLPADIDGTTQPPPGMPAPVIGTQDDGGPYGAPFDALNVWDFTVFFPAYAAVPHASLTLSTQIPVAAFDSIFPCSPGARDCLPQPGISSADQKLDHLGYRQRPTFRLAYRIINGHESMVTNQSVEALPGVAGVRWYEIQRNGGAYSLAQQGTYVPDDGVHRWMGSIAQDSAGNMLLGYSVVNGTSVFPGIRFTGRSAGDPPGTMTLAEQTIISGTGIQTTTNSRWGDYTAMTLDPTDDCTFWYVDEYYTLEGQMSSAAGWQTRVGNFKMPSCGGGH